MAGWLNGMIGWLNRIMQFLNLWVIRMVVISSFTAHLVAVLFGGVRRRKASGWRTFLLWLAYQVADRAAKYALGNLFFGSTSREQQLVAFWAPFLLTYLGGPDNISAYSLEDNTLSWRQVTDVVTQVLGTGYALYKHIYTGCSGTLLPASIIVFIVGVAKYVERVFSLRRANPGSIRSSSEKQQPSPASERRVGFRIGRDLDDEQALLVAHDQFHFCRRAMVDSSSVGTNLPSHDTSRKIFSYEWKGMCKVVEMERSLMYDILYTKAAMVHTWGGYFIRFVSPPATAAAFMLFWFYSKVCQRPVDVIITYVLLVAAFLLDLRWLLRALGSTWTHAFLDARPRCWLHHAFLCTGRWHRLRRVVVSLDPRRWLVRAPSSYRLSSGIVGQYNLLHECTHDTTSLCSRLAKMVGLEDAWDEYRYSEGLEISGDVKELLFERIRQVLKSTDGDESTLEHAYSMEDVTTCWGQVAAKQRGQKLRRFEFAFGREFQEDVLVWHIATQVFLLCSDQQLNTATGHAKAIKALSEYLMFLVAVRPHMLPGLELRSLYEVTREALDNIWSTEGGKKNHASSSSTREEKLARILRDMKDTDKGWGLEDEKTRLVSDGAALAINLLRAYQSDMAQLLQLVFNVWVDKLLYAGARCSWDSHAKQLSRGGELTTTVWIMAEHAGPFRIGQKTPAATAREEKIPDDEEEADVPQIYVPAYCCCDPKKPACCGCAPKKPACCCYAPKKPADEKAPEKPADEKAPKEKEDTREETIGYSTLYPVN